MAEKKEIPREGLKRAREARGLSQARLAELIKVGGAKTVARWESGRTTPYAYQRPRLAEHLGITLEELEALLANDRQEEALRLQSLRQQPHRRWLMPHQLTPYFTGRDGLLGDLRSALLAKEAGVQIVALIGQAGIGKTQVARAYADHYGEEYQAILWAAGDARNALVADYARIASILHLPAKDDPDKQRVVDGVKEWLSSNTGWLLVIDNVSDANLLDDFLPQGQGHVLLTARDPEVGTRARPFTVEKLGKDVGAALLLRRAKRFLEQSRLNRVAEREGEVAREISEKMDGHPLALDQAGAYIAESGCTLAEYLELYRARRDELLNDRGRNNFGHPDSLAATILLSLEKVEQVDPVAANVLRMCAFLHPDDIPQELFAAGDVALAPRYHPVAATPSLLTQAVRELVKYSFVQLRTDTETELKAVSVHRLVQAVIMDQMDDETQFYWAEHAVWVMARTLSRLELGAWNRYQRYIPHALACIEHIHQWQMFNEATIYFIKLVGDYLRETASYSQAEPIYLRALLLAQEILVPEHDFLCMSLHSLATLYERMGHYEQAETYYLKVIAAFAKKPEPDELTSASISNNLARLYLLRGKYSDAESLAQRVLAIQESLSGVDPPEVAGSLITLAEIYSAQRKYTQAEPLLQRALSIREKEQESDPLALAQVLNSLIVFYTSQGRHKEARPFCQRVLYIIEHERGPKHPQVAAICSNTAEVYRYLGELSQAERYCKRALEILEGVYGPGSVHMIRPLTVLAAIYQRQGKYPEAESLFEVALSVTEGTLGPEHPDMASVLSAYSWLLREMERYDEADGLDEKALNIRRLWLSPLELLKEEQAVLQRKYLRKGRTIIYNGVRMTVEEFLALRDSPSEDTIPPEETTSGFYKPR